MTRLTSVRTHVWLAVAALGLLVTAPLSAQTPPPRATMPAPGPTPPGIEPTFLSNITAPIPMPGQQGRAPQGQGIQTTPPASAAPRPETPRAPFIGSANNAQMPASTNIKLDLAITDTFTGSPVKKTVSMLVLTGNSGMIRTTSVDGWATLNVDAVAGAYVGGMVSVRLTFEYTPAVPKDTTGRPPRLNESITVALQDGKPMMVSQSADPATDRRVTAELTATILK